MLWGFHFIPILRGHKRIANINHTNQALEWKQCTGNCASVLNKLYQNTPTSMNTDISILIITLPLPSTSISISPAETGVHTSRVYHIHVYFVHQYIVCIREQSVRVFLYILLNRVCVPMWFVDRWALNAVNCASSTEWVVSTHNKASYLCFLN